LIAGTLIVGTKIAGMPIAGTMPIADVETVSKRASPFGARPMTLHSLCGSTIRRHSNTRRQTGSRSINPRRLR
jgi:hypothetical protein